VQQQTTQESHVKKDDQQNTGPQQEHVCQERKTAKVEKKCSPTVVRLSSCCSPAVALLLN